MGPKKPRGALGFGVACHGLAWLGIYGLAEHHFNNKLIDFTMAELLAHHQSIIRKG